jgi:hypothetical protein
MLAASMGLIGYALILVLFATWFTVHTLLCWQLATRSWRKAVVGFFIVPLCPYWGRQEGFIRSTFAWLGSVTLYGLSLLHGLT